MKIQYIALTIPLLCTSFTASATTSIIGGDTLNGNFATTDFWTTGFNVEDISINTTDENAVVGQLSGNVARGVVQNTGYNVALDDTFDLSFTWRSANNWDANSTLHWTLFTSSDDTTAGTVTIIGSGSITGTNSGETPYDNSNTNYNTITGASDGKDLWVEFYAFKPGATATAFSRLDNVNLSVVPEPSTYALISGMLGLASVMVRRRK